MRGRANPHLDSTQALDSFFLIYFISITFFVWGFFAF
jgi:hypothetical protein